MATTLKLTSIINDQTRGINYSINGLSVATSADHVDAGSIDVATSETTLTLKTDIGNAGYCWLVNRDSTNYVRFGFATTAYYIRMKAGEPAGPFRLEPGTSALYLIADSATCRVDYVIYED